MNPSIPIFILSVFILSVSLKFSLYAKLYLPYSLADPVGIETNVSPPQDQKSAKICTFLDVKRYRYMQLY